MAPSPGGGATPDVSMPQLALWQAKESSFESASAYGNSTCPSMLPPPLSEFLMLPSEFLTIFHQTAVK